MDEIGGKMSSSAATAAATDVIATSSEILSPTETVLVAKPVLPSVTMAAAKSQVVYITTGTKDDHPLYACLMQQGPTACFRLDELSSVLQREGLGTLIEVVVAGEKEYAGNEEGWKEHVTEQSGARDEGKKRVYRRSREDQAVAGNAEAEGAASPILLLRLPSDEAASSVCRSMFTMKVICRCVAQAATINGLCKRLVAGPSAFSRGPVLATAWCMRVAGLGRTVSHSEAMTVIAALEPSLAVPPGSRVDLRRPTVKLWLWDNSYAAANGPVTWAGPTAVPPCGWREGRQSAGLPCRYTCGREVFDNRKVASKVVAQFSLQNGRRYLGPTSMDAAIAFIMANVANARPGCLVLDPFVGSGSILVACAKLGARCMGADICGHILAGPPDR